MRPSGILANFKRPDNRLLRQKASEVMSYRMSCISSLVTVNFEVEDLQPGHKLLR